MYPGTSTRLGSTLSQEEQEVCGCICRKLALRERERGGQGGCVNEFVVCAKRVGGL